MAVPTTEEKREGELEFQIAELLSDAQYEGHPLKEALSALWERYESLSGQIEKLTSISDGYGSMLRERNARLDERNQRHLRQLQKIVRISDHYQKMLQEMNDTLKVSASQDPLTGLNNRRSIMERLAAEVTLVPRRKAALSLALLDIDHFKTINDSFGHDVGDHVLVNISRVMSEQVRSSDVCARWGGEEFLIMLPDSGDYAHEVCERLRLTIEKSSFVEGSDYKVTASIGVTQYIRGEDILETLKRADSALFAAKHKGRNCVAAF